MKKRGRFATEVFLLLVLGAGCLWLARPAQAEEVKKLATVLVYHRFGEDTIPSTNTPLADFQAHLDTLKTTTGMLSPPPI